MRLMIENSQERGPIDYTAALDVSVTPRVERKINRPTHFRCVLSGTRDFVIPVAGARVTVQKTNGEFMFTGYLMQAPQHEYLGWGEGSAVYRYNLVAESDEVLLDQKALPNRAPFVARSGGSALRQLVEELLPGEFETSGVQAVDVLASYRVNPQRTFSDHAAEIALAVRGSYRTMNQALLLAPVGETTHAISEDDAHFSAAGLTLAFPKIEINDVTVIGFEEPQAYVRDYFVGDGMSLRFYLSQKPFGQSWRALIDEQYKVERLDPETWSLDDPASAVSVAAQTLHVDGGTGQDGETTVAFIEQVELGGALKLQHGDVSFSAVSRGVIGGLYSSVIGIPQCLAGFQVTPSGGASSIRALINGAPSGPTVTTTAGHRYLLTTYLYATEVYRAGETFHSSVRPAGSGVGGEVAPADVRVVLGVQDIDPANPATMVAPATVLYDGVIANAPAFCIYALLNAADMQCSIAYTYVTHISLAEIRSAIPNANYVTRLVGPLSDGGECRIAGTTTLDFYPQYVPPLNTLIVASYRGAGPSVAEVENSASVANLANGADDGVRGIVRVMNTPNARTQADCESAALAILDDAGGPAWSGVYETWSDFLPGSTGDIFPGDAVAVNVPSQDAVFEAIVRTVGIDFVDPANDRGKYTIDFANDLARPLGYEHAASNTNISLRDTPPRLTTSQVGSYYAANLTEAQITEVTSTTVQVDAGVAPGSGGGIEVRAHDFGWGAANDRNLLGRFGARTFSLPRLSRTQNYFLRLYDNTSPPRYSRYTAALHVDYPL